MCNSDTPSEDADNLVKPLKPVPGSLPSSSHMRAQELIKKHLLPKSPNTTEDESDGYSGDTEEYIDSDLEHGNQHSSDDVSINNVKPKLEPPDPVPDPNKPSTSKGLVKPVKTKPRIVSKIKTKKGQLDIELKGYIKTKKVRKVTCPKCKFIGFSTKELNEHYWKKHQPIPCNSCLKTFTNPSSHRRHMYIHTNATNTFTCHRCTKTFPFESQLHSHKDFRHRLSTFACLQPGVRKCLDMKPP